MPINDNDDGIEFIGWSHPSPPNTTIDNNPVTGITIHVQDPLSGESSTHTYHKAHSPTVEIGRLPGTDAPGKYFDGDDNKALFRCPVVSRKHAKIAFSDSGFAYIIDLTSHHGTYLLQGQSEQPEKLKPEIPLRLLDNAEITFGKTVGKGEETVDPVSITVHLLHESPPKTTSIQRTNSGRFSAPFEVSDEDSVYNDSDVEEIPPPLPPPPATAPPPIPTQMHTPVYPIPIPFPPFSTSTAQQEQPSSMGRALEVLKTLIPPAHTPFARYQPSLPPPVNNYIDRESYSPFPPVYTPEYSPGFGDEFGDFLSGGIEYYDPPREERDKDAEAEKDKEDKGKDKEVEKVEEEKEDKGGGDYPSPGSNMDLETPAPVSRHGSPSVSPSRSPSCSPSSSHTRSLSKDKEEQRRSPSLASSYQGSASGSEFEGSMGGSEYNAPPESPRALFAACEIEVNDDMPEPEAREELEVKDTSPERRSTSPSPAQEQQHEQQQQQQQEEEEEEHEEKMDEEEEEEDSDSESVSTTFDPFASFHCGYSKDWFGSPEFVGPQGVPGALSVPVLVRAPGGEDDDTTTTISGNTTILPPSNNTTMLPPNNTTMLPPSNNATMLPPSNNTTMLPPTNNTTILSTCNNATSTSNTSMGMHHCPVTSPSKANSTTTAHPDTLPPITSTPAERQVRALPSLSKMRFMGMNDVLCEASVWKFGRPEKGKKEEKVEKVEEKTEDEKEKEEKEKNKVEEKAEEKTEEKEKEKEDVEMEEEEGEEDAEGEDDDEVEEEEEEEEEVEEEEEEEDEDEDENENEEMADVSGLRTDISAIQVELNKLKTHRKKYKFRFNSNVRAVDNRFSSITSSLAPLTPLPGEIKEVREDLEKLVKEVGDVNERVGELREEMWQVSNERDCRALEEEEEREDAKEERDREVVAYALEDMRAAQREMERVTAELDDAKIETANVRKDVEAKMACLDDSVDAVGKDVKVVGDDVASLKVALDRLKTAAIGLASLLETRHKEGKEYTDGMVRTVRDVGAVTQNLVESHSEKLLNLNREMEGVVHTRLGSLSARLDKFHVEFDEAKEKEEDRSDHFVRRLSLAEKRLDDMEVDRSDADQTVDDVFARVDDIEALALDERVGAIERHVGEVVARREEVDREREETVRELKGLVAEMRQLREDTQKQMAHDLQSVKAAKELAMVCISKTTQSFSLKRKRDGVEDAGALSPVGFSAPPTPTPSSAISTAAQDVIMGELTAPVTVLDTEGKVDAATEAVEGGGEDELQGLVPPPRKKAKKVVNVLAQTATALTVGAVATWTALAFS